MILSSKSKNKIPNHIPITTGTKDSLPISDVYSNAGIIRLHIEAATITPAANPSKIRCNNELKSFFIKNTQQAPKQVPTKGIKILAITSVVNNRSSYL